MERRRREDRAQQYKTAAYQNLAGRFGANVRRVRESLGLTQAEAAERCSLGTKHLQRIEAADMNLTLTTIARICEGFALDVREFFAPVAPLAKRRRGRPAKVEAATKPDDSAPSPRKGKRSQ